ncbi:hypothetical protein GCK72_021503 [Caenorhabditis remanei]|uniref:Uncharacterized protein n=1 Tax=Caenorhabditis remanei TaxID=31234 RepID=A0A6A5GIC5_CAERE|nr:hypothetical protein GCK72_021503 [Caenorhabditis remanei]KAF1754938.1 hypothetical protein GCK72_021503 [Caenorhabditis remanei]
MSDSVSDKESSFEFLNESDASDGELEQITKASDGMEDQVIKPGAPAQTVAHKVNTPRATSPAKFPPTAANKLIVSLIIACLILFIMVCVFIEAHIRHLELCATKITATKLREDQISQELERVKRDLQRETSARDEIIKQYEISARDKIIEELKNDKRDLQKVIDMKERKDSFMKIKCLEDIPEKLMDKWILEENEFQEIDEFDQPFGDSRPIFTKLSETQMRLKLIDNKEPYTLWVDNCLMEGPCTYTIKTDEGVFGQVFVKEGLLYIILGAPEEEKIKLVYIMPEEYL